MDVLPRGLTLPIYTVDAFADVPFSGNQAAVVPVPEDVELSESIMQMLAAEMNYAETSFVKQLPGGGDFKNGEKFGLRWFTPTSEVPLCGHATLAAAAALFNEIGNVNETVEFQTRYSGSLFSRRSGETITIDLPVNKTAREGTEGFDELIEILTCGKDVQDLAWNATLPMLLIRLSDALSRQEFESFQPDIRKAEGATDRTKMVVVTMKARSGAGFEDRDGRTFDFVSRFFAPWFGVDEDSVTGAAHTVLADYWSRELKKNEMYARQCSQRGGNVGLKVRESGRVELTGKGLVIVRGTISF